MAKIDVGRPPRVLLASSPDWDNARQAWNLAVDQHPAAIAPRSFVLAGAVKGANLSFRREALQAIGGFDPERNRSYIMYLFTGGGYGGFQGGDGLSNGCSTIGISKMPPVEVLEQLHVALEGEGGVLVQGMERCVKDAGSQIAVGHRGVPDFEIAGRRRV